MVFWLEIWIRVKGLLGSLGIQYGNLNISNHDVVGKERRRRDRPKKNEALIP